MLLHPLEAIVFFDTATEIAAIGGIGGGGLFEDIIFGGTM